VLQGQHSNKESFLGKSGYHVTKQDVRTFHSCKGQLAISRVEVVQYIPTQEFQEHSVLSSPYFLRYHRMAHFKWRYLSSIMLMSN
jgi:hypothetical protein